LSGGLLLVEGDPAEAELLVRVLGPGVRLARDAGEAIAELAERRPCALLVSDRLPGVDGLALLERLRANPAFASLPIIVLTGSRNPALTHRAYTLGANSVVRKPLAFDELRGALQDVATYWLQRNEPGETAVNSAT
jgi:two-component system response regulator